VLAGRGALTRPGTLARHVAGRARRRAGARALADPVGRRAQRAAQLAGAAQVAAVPRAQREDLPVAGLESGQARRAGEAVVGVRPCRGERRILTGGAHPVGELGQAVTAPLSDRRERRRVPGQLQRDLVCLPGAVDAWHGSHGQHRPINAV
jgi:hypothetical protein